MRGFKFFQRMLEVLASLVLFMLMVITFVDVSGRNVLNRPLTGAAELIEILLVTMVFILLPGIAIRRLHIIVDLIDSIAGPFLDRVQDLCAAIFGGGLFAIMTWRFWIMGERAISYHDQTPSLQLPISPVFFAAAVFCAFTTIAFLVVPWIPRSPRGQIDIEHMAD